jgi:hypothetical protein
MMSEREELVRPGENHPHGEWLWAIGLVVLVVLLLIIL